MKISAEQRIINMLFKAKKPISLDNKNTATKVGLSIIEMNSEIQTICEKAELIFSDFSDLYDPKSYYKMNELYFCLSGGGMSADIYRANFERNIRQINGLIKSQLLASTLP